MPGKFFVGEPIADTIPGFSSVIRTGPSPIIEQEI